MVIARDMKIEMYGLYFMYALSEKRRLASQLFIKHTLLERGFMNLEATSRHLSSMYMRRKPKHMSRSFSLYSIQMPY